MDRIDGCLICASVTRVPLTMQIEDFSFGAASKDESGQIQTRSIHPCEDTYEVKKAHLFLTKAEGKLYLGTGRQKPINLEKLKLHFLQLSGSGNKFASCMH